MRLINVKTLELEQFYGGQTPRYAILSHTWDGDNEVTFQEWERRTDSAVKRKSGYAKIVGACRRAQADGYQYLWCDTNCIDKSSSAELSEAINSMFAWYHDSAVCYAYLADVQAKTETFTKSRWFTRGWTLQELLAPSKVIFFDCRWTVLGDRSELANIISDTTRIHIGALMNHSTIHSYSIAQRMSWAADRQTTHSEDIAYCLLGVFDINMPLLYGEGLKAFARLQQQIISVSADQSILAWELQDSSAPLLTGALALSPANFRLCGSIARSYEIHHNPYSMTNLGISMKLPLLETLVGGLVLVGLNCARELHREASHSRIPDGVQLSRHFRIWIPLRRLERAIYVRTHDPSSKMFLGQSYQLLGHPTAANLILNLEAPRTLTTCLTGPTALLRLNSSILPPGLLIMLAAGKTFPRSNSLKEAYPLGDVSVIQLKRRGTSTISHQLISSGSFSVILSVFWDNCRSPQEWLYTVIYNPELKVTAEMVSQEDWNCLFQTKCHVQPADCCNSLAAMHSLHRKLQQLHVHHISEYVGDEKDPMVAIESRPLRDSFQQAELIVDIIFRERGTPTYSGVYDH